MADDQHWSVDKRIPVGGIVAGFLTGAVFIIGQTWYLASTLSAYNYRLSSVEDFVKAAQPLQSEMAVMKEKLTTMQTSINKIETLFFTRVPDSPPVTPNTPPQSWDQRKPQTQR